MSVSLDACNDVPFPKEGTLSRNAVATVYVFALMLIVSGENHISTWAPSKLT